MATAVMTYQGIVSVSNEIRNVLDTARQVNLAAQNASLAARRAGTALGFQAVSAELKAFSQNLANAMDGMAEDILAIAEGVSSGYKELRMSRHYDNTHRMAGEHLMLNGAQERVQRRQQAIRGLQTSRVQALATRLGRSTRMCMNGRSLARSALIEATAGGESEAMLRNNFQLYDPTARILFSGDVGAAMAPPEEDRLFVEDFDRHIRHAEKFHRRWMGSNEAKLDWCERAARMPIDMLCPQHGSIYQGQDVMRFINWFAELRVGTGVRAEPLSSAA